jgi:hypothetical protein
MLRTWFDQLKTRGLLGIKRLSARRAVSVRRGKKARVHLAVETLESRTVLTAGVNQTYVAMLYHGALHRDAFAPDESYWAGSLDNGTMTRTQVATGIDRSDAAHREDIAQDYENDLGRPLDPAGENYWVGEVAGGDSLENADAQIIGSGEFYNHAGATEDAFLQSAETDLLGRNLDPAGKAYFEGELNQGMSRTTIAEQIANSQEAVFHQIQEIYTNDLGRPADAAAFPYWSLAGSTDSSSGVWDPQTVAGGVAGSAELAANIANNLGATDTNDPNAAAAAISAKIGAFAGFMKSYGQPAFTVHPDPNLQPLVFSSTPTNRSPGALLEITNTGSSGSLVHYQVTGSINGPNGTIPLDLPSNAQGMLVKGLGEDIYLGVNSAGLAKGIYSGSLTVRDVDGIAAPVTVPVELAVDTQVVIQPPRIGGGTFTIVTPQSPLILTATGTDRRPTSTVTITNNDPGGLALHYQVTGSINGPSGAIPVLFDNNAHGYVLPNESVVVQFVVDVHGLRPGTYTGSLTITDPSGMAATKTVPITLQAAADTLPNLEAIATQVGDTFYYQVTGSTFGTVYGTDTYTSDSSIATAAVHAGVLRVGQTAVVKVTMVQPLSVYQGSKRNGVTTLNWTAGGRNAYRVSASGL